MNKKISRQTCLADAVPGTQFSVSLKRLKRSLALVIVALLMAWHPAQAEEQPDDQYLRIYGLIEQADSLDTKGQAGQALAKYREAQTALENFQKGHPAWNAKVVAFRLDYLAGKVAALSEKAPAVAGSTAAAGTSAAQSETKPAISASSTPPAKLLEAGAEPRKVLRLHPKPGDKQTLNMTIKMAIDMKIGEMQNPAMNMPAMKLAMDTTVKSVSADGDITCEIVVSDASVTEDSEAAPQVVAAMKASFAGAKGLSGTATMSGRGFNKGTEMKAPPGAAQAGQLMDQMKEAFANLTVELPEEAVGSGARWEVRRLLKSQGMTIDQTVTYQLVSIDGEHLTLKAAIAQRASNQKIQNPAMPGLKVDLIKMAGKGSGDFTVDLAQLLPSKGTADLQSDHTMGMNVGGQKQTMTMKMNQKVRLEAK
jgi:hypothetical protein